MNIQEKKCLPSRAEIANCFRSTFSDKMLPEQWCWSLVWLLVLLLVVWPLSLLAAILYVLISPFSACCECTEQITEFLHKGIVLPLTVATFVVAGRNCTGL